MKIATITLQIIFFLAGAFIIYTGLNVALGGIPTLGWQGQTPFFQVTDNQMFLIEDSHTRFLGGVWTGVGILFLLAPIYFRQLTQVLKFAILLIFLGGLARFTQMQPDVLLNRDILGSLIAELAGMPVLYVWLSSVTGSKNEG